MPGHLCRQVRGLKADRRDGVKDATGDLIPLFTKSWRVYSRAFPGMALKLVNIAVTFARLYFSDI